MTLDYVKKARKRFINRKQKEHKIEGLPTVLDDLKKAPGKKVTWAMAPPMPSSERVKIAKERAKTERQFGVKRGR